DTQAVCLIFTHKKLRSPCNLPNQFICQISSSLDFHQLPASAGMGLTHSGVCKLQSSSNPMFGAKQLSVNRKESVVALTPNIGLILTSRCRSIRIDATLDLRDALLMLKDHCRDRDRTANQHR